MIQDRTAPAELAGSAGGTRSSVVRSAFAVLAVLSALAFAAVVVLWIMLGAQSHRYTDITKANQSAATVKANTQAQSFYRSLLTAEAAGPLTTARLWSMTHAAGVAGVAARAPIDGTGVVHVDYRVSAVYVEAGGFGGGSGMVQQCYQATLPKPGSGAAASLREEVCGTAAY